MNKYRLKFSKNGPIKFIGHLDVMRYFQKAIRRAEIDIKYSEGFSPHQVISFAQPLSVGATSDGEYMDITLDSFMDCDDLKDSLNAVMNEGIKIISVIELADNDEKAMTACYAAKYKVRFRKSCKPDFDWITKLKQYLSNDHLPAMKKTKSGEKEIDMKPLIFDYNFDEKDESVTLLLSMSSSATLKVSLLFKYFFESISESISDNALDIHRIEIYKQSKQDDLEFIEPLIPGDEKMRFYLGK